MATPEDLVRQQYPTYAWALEIPEIKAALDMAVAEGWPPDRLQSALQGTQWYKARSGSMRAWESLWQTDPSSAQQQWNSKAMEVGAMTTQLGVDVRWDQIEQIAWDAIRFNWNQAEVRHALGQQFGTVTGPQWGATASGLRRLAGEYLVPMSDEVLNRWGTQIVSGQATEETFRSYLVEQAKSLFPSLAVFLDQGGTVKTYVEPYRQIAAKELEISPEDVNFLDPKWGKALFQVDPKSGQRVSMSLSEWQNEIRKNDVYGWDATRGAREASAELQQSLLKQFGVM